MISYFTEHDYNFDDPATEQALDFIYTKTDSMEDSMEDSTKTPSMRLSKTLEEFSMDYDYSETYLRLRDVCLLEGFDLDDLLYQIWKNALYGAFIK